MPKIDLQAYIRRFFDILRVRYQLQTRDYYKDANKFKESVITDLAKRIENEIKHTDYRSLADAAEILDGVTEDLAAQLAKLKSKSPLAFRKVLQEQSIDADKLAQAYEQVYNHMTKYLALPSSFDEEMFTELLPNDPRARKQLHEDPVFAELVANKATFEHVRADDTQFEFLLVLLSFERWLAKAARAIAVYLKRERMSRKHPDIVTTPVLRANLAMFLVALRKAEIVQKVDEREEEELELLLNYAYSDLDTLIHATNSLHYIPKSEEISQAREMVAELWG